MSADEARIHIVGIGSPTGDDRLGWAAIESLRHSPIIRSYGKNVNLTSVDRPGARLLGEFRAGQYAILIDAVRSDKPAGTLHCLRDNEALVLQGGLSSHGFGVADSLALARALGCLPNHWVVLGLEAGTPSEVSTLSPPMRDALPALVRAIEHETQTYMIASCG